MYRRTQMATGGGALIRLFIRAGQTLLCLVGLRRRSAFTLDKKLSLRLVGSFSGLPDAFGSTIDPKVFGPPGGRYEPTERASPVKIKCLNLKCLHTGACQQGRHKEVFAHGPGPPDNTAA